MELMMMVVLFENDEDNRIDFDWNRMKMIDQKTVG